jgi:hypothetical protein
MAVDLFPGFQRFAEVCFGVGSCEVDAIRTKVSKGTMRPNKLLVIDVLEPLGCHAVRPHFHHDVWKMPLTSSGIPPKLTIGIARQRWIHPSCIPLEVKELDATHAQHIMEENCRDEMN